MREHFTGETLRRAANFSRATNWRRAGRKTISLMIATVILSLYATANSATPKLNSKASIGTITINGVVQINGSRVISGQTLFSGSNIRIGPKSESSLDLGNLARLKLEAETSLTLESSDLGLSASLDNGAMRAIVPSGIRGGITTADASITTGGSQPAVFSVLVDSCSTTLSVQTGPVEIRFGNNLRSVASGESFSTGGAPLPSGPQQNLSNGKKVGLVLGIGGAIAILLIALTREDAVVDESFGGSVVNPSPR